MKSITVMNESYLYVTGSNWNGMASSLCGGLPCCVRREPADEFLHWCSDEGTAAVVVSARLTSTSPNTEVIYTNCLPLLIRFCILTFSIPFKNLVRLTENKQIVICIRWKDEQETFN